MFVLTFAAGPHEINSYDHYQITSSTVTGWSRMKGFLRAPRPMAVETYQDPRSAMCAALHSRRFSFSAMVSSYQKCDCCPIRLLVDPDATATEARQKDALKEVIRCNGCNLQTCPHYYTTAEKYAFHHGHPPTESEKVHICPACYSEANQYMKKDPFCKAKHEDGSSGRGPCMKFGKENGHRLVKVQRCVQLYNCVGDAWETANAFFYVFGRLE